MEKKYTDRDVYLVILGACNNYCASERPAGAKERITDFAKWILKDKENPEWITSRELPYGLRTEQNLEFNGTLFDTRSKLDQRNNIYPNGYKTAQELENAEILRNKLKNENN